MRKLFFFIILPIFLPIVVGKFTLVIKQVIDDEEVPLNGSSVTAFGGDNLQFNCYLYLTFRNNSFIHGNVQWQIPFYSDNVENNDSSIITIRRADWSDEGKYTCIAKMHFLIKSFYLNVNVRPYDVKIPNVEFPKVEILNDDFFKYKDLLNHPNFTEIKIPNLYSYTDKGPIFFVPAVIVIILGIVRMCYYLRSRSNVSWERLHTTTCSHRLCAHRRRTTPSAPCLLQSSLSSRLSIVIVGRVNESGVDNSTRENDVPPAYNEVIPQDLPPTYSEAVENSTETPSESRT